MITQLTDWMESNLDAYLEDLAWLVNRDCGTDYKAGVDGVADWVASRCAELGAEIERRPQEDYGDLLLARWRGDGTARILLSAHMDTVYPRGIAEQRQLRRDGDRLVGPGVSDMKAGLLSGLYAVQVLLDHESASWKELAFIFSSDEEVGSPVSRDWLQEIALAYDAGLVLESARPDGSLVTARKGGGFMELRVEGRPAHAGVEPEKGASALRELAHQIVELERLNGTIAGATVVVTLAEGGSARNVVPAHARATIDARVVEERSRQDLRTAIREVVQKRHVPGTSVELIGDIDRPPWSRGRGTIRLYEQARDIAGELDISLGETRSGGTSDGSFLAGAGLPVLDGLGPIGGADHSPDEYLEVPSIVPRTAILAELIRRLAQPSVDDRHSDKN